MFIIQIQRRRAFHQKELMQMKADYEQTILQSQIEIQEQTLKNISQEIHDNIGQVLSLAKLNLNTIEDSAVSEKLSLTESLLGKAISDLRDLSRSLHTEKISDIGLVDAIRHELFIVQKAARIQTELIADEYDLKTEGNKAVIIFRMIQEIIHNTLKHAKAENIKIFLWQEAGITHIKVTDDGQGFDQKSLKNKDTGIGLKSMQQRCKLIDATCTIDTAPGKGTSVHLVINKSYF